MSKEKNYDYTAKERKQQERKRMKELGFKRKEYWVHKDDEQSANKYMEDKKNKRLDELNS